MSENASASGVLIERLDGIFQVITQALGIAEKIQKLFPQERNKRIYYLSTRLRLG